MQFEKSADTKVIETLLVDAEVGDTITYESISKAIGRDVRVHALASLRSARLGLLNSKGYVFGVVQNVGLTRLNDKQIIASTEQDRQRLLRGAKSSLKKLSKVSFETLSEDDRRRHVTASAQMGAIAMFAHADSRKKIESKVQTQSTLAIGETLKMFTD